MISFRTQVLVGLFACGIGASGGAAQTASIDASGAESDDAFLDPEARALHATARARWYEVDR